MVPDVPPKAGHMALAALIQLVQDATMSFCVIHVDGDEGSHLETADTANPNLSGINSLDRRAIEHNIELFLLMEDSVGLHLLLKLLQILMTCSDYD